MKPFSALLLLLLFVTCFSAVAQAIRGEVLDMETRKPVADVSIQNVHRSLTVTTDTKGGFLIAAISGQLLEFKKDGYNVARVRIPNGMVPPYFRIILTRTFTMPVYAENGNRYDYKADSIRFHELYKHELDFPKMTAIEMIKSPFSALSSKNRAIWQFQDDYIAQEQEKYVDRTFNERLITKFTGLSGDSLVYFMRRYRPTYDQVRAMNDYTFFNFIKANAAQFRHHSDTPRTSQ